MRVIPPALPRCILRLRTSVAMFGFTRYQVGKIPEVREHHPDKTKTADQETYFDRVIANIEDLLARGAGDTLKCDKGERGH